MTRRNGPQAPVSLMILPTASVLGGVPGMIGGMKISFELWDECVEASTEVLELLAPLAALVLPRLAEAPPKVLPPLLAVLAPVEEVLAPVVAEEVLSDVVVLPRELPPDDVLLVLPPVIVPLVSPPEIVPVVGFVEFWVV